MKLVVPNCKADALLIGMIDNREIDLLTPIDD